MRFTKKIKDINQTRAGDMFSMKYRIGIYKKIYKVIIIDNSTLWEGGMYRHNLVEVIGQPVVRSVKFFLY